MEAQTQIKTAPYKLGFLSLTIIVISLVVGMGIFKTPSISAAKANSVDIFYLAWLVGAIVTICGALTYSEIGLHLPSIGGYYNIFNTLYHKSIGFTINILILISNAASLAIVAIIGSEYLSHLLTIICEWTLTYWQQTCFASLFIIIFWILNLKGLKSGSFTQNILMGLKILLIIIIISAQFIPHSNLINTSEIAPNLMNEHNSFYSFILCLVSIAFTYGGFQQTLNFSGEVKDIKIFKLSMIIGVCFLGLLYLGVCVAYVKVIGFENLGQTQAIGAVVFQFLFGKYGGIIFDCCMILSVLAYVNVILLSNPRVLFAMSSAKLLPKFLMKYNQKSGVFSNSLAVFSMLTLLVIVIGKSVDKLINFSIFIDSMGMILSGIVLFYLPKKLNLKPLHIKYKISAFIFILYYCLITVAILFDKPLEALTALCLMSICLIYYFVKFKHSHAT